MKVNGIVAEYNPFHNGHKYHLEDARKRNGADYTVVVMSGNFVQRGAPALLDKFSRARMALSCGADLVLELPVFYAVSSAEYFATGAVALLDKLGVVDHLCFGSECGDLAILSRIAHILLTEPAEYTALLKDNLKQGHSYPNARTGALIQYDPSLSSSRDVLSSPNNILGIEYLKALKRRESTILPDTTLRIGSDYRDKRLGDHQSSALAIRHAISSGQDHSFLINQMPECAYQITKKALEQSLTLEVNDFSAALHYKLLQEKEKGYTEYLDVSPDLSERILNNLDDFTGFQDFCDLLKSKDMTYTRISRCLLHILLDIRTSALNSYRSMDYVPYARVLGFRKEASPLLAAIKEHASIPLITKLADAGTLLGSEAYNMLQRELSVNSIYQSGLSLKSGRPMPNEYRTPIVIL
ncbi:MAG: nucleotidyltransferase [Lachnospiraceae bacterium]|nr:nucleotidyltransferase [Lachnospiraceae bacterium]